MTDRIASPLLAAASLLGGALLIQAPQALASPVQVTGEVSLTRTNPAQLQEAAVHRAMENALDAAALEAMGGSAHALLHPLLEERILRQAEGFVTAYALESSARGETTYSVKLGLELDGPLLRRRLISAGLLPGPGSPPLAAVFVSLDRSWPSARAPFAAGALTAAIGSALRGRGVAAVPPPLAEEKKPRARLLAAPLLPGPLATAGRLAGVALAVGVEGGPLPGRPGTLQVRVQLADAGVRTLVGETVVELETGASFRGDLSGAQLRRVAEVAAALVPAAAAAPGEGKGGEPALLAAEGATVSALRDLSLLLANALGEESPLVPRRAEAGRIEFRLLTARPAEEVRGHLAELGPRAGFLAEEAPGGFLLHFPPRAAGRLKALRQEVPFYRRAPRAGVANPDDIRKVEEVAWEEVEPDDEPFQALPLPAGGSVLGRIEPTRDRDSFRCEIPRGAEALAVTVEQTGPGEFRPSVRVFDPSGRSLASLRSPARGRSLSGVVPVPRGTPWVLVVVEDHLGRNVTRFPYVLAVAPPAEEPR